MTMDDEARRAAGLRERAEALIPVLAGRAAETEALRRLPDETMADVKANGLHRICQPRRFGGAELPLDEAARIIAALAQGCASASWVCTVFTDHSIIAGMFDPSAADDVWADDPDATISAGYLPSGSAERDGDGWRITGTWGFASGCDHADWLLLGSPLPTEDGGVAPSLCLAPRREVTIDDNWHVMGLAGTGSKNVVARDCAIPAHRALPLAAAAGGAEARGRTDAPPLYRLPHVSTVPFLFAANGLGVAESLLETVIGQMKRSSALGADIAGLPTMQMHVAEASAEIACARRSILGRCAEAMAAMRAGRSLTLAERARNRRDQAYAGRLCRRAVERLFAAAGAKAIFADNAAQRKFRDMQAIGSHIAMNWDIAGATFGRVAFGLEPDTPLI